MLIQLHGIEYAYPDGNVALRGIDLSIGQGRNVAFLGANGSGKSTIFLLLAGLLRPRSGTYTLAGRSISWTRADRSYISQTLGLVFQDPDVQILNSTVFKEVAYGPTNLGLPQGEILQRTQQAMYLCGIDHLSHRSPQSLSFGQKKSVCIASILAMQTDIIVFDEPMAWLDPFQKQEMKAVMHTLRSCGKTVLVSTHSTDFAYEWADEIHIIGAGRVLASGGGDAVFAQNKVIESSHLRLPLAYRLSQISGRSLRSEDDIVAFMQDLR